MNKENIHHLNVPPNVKMADKVGKCATSQFGIDCLLWFLIFLQSKDLNFDLLDRGQTPERIEFEAGISDPEEAHSQMDEDEWTDRNFGQSTAENGSSDEISDMRFDGNEF